MKHTTPGITTGYVVKGFWSYIKHSESLDEDLGPIVEKSDEMLYGGELNLMQCLVDRAHHVENAWVKHFASTGDSFNGVWEYEVSEPFGEILAIHLINHKRLPDHAQCKLMAESLALTPKDEQS